MKNFLTLRILDLFKGAFTSFGINYPTMRRILQVKLTMDQRRVPTIFSQSNKKLKEDSNHFMKSLWLYSFMGLFLIPFLFIGDNYFFQMSIIFGISMFLIMTSMISDFSSVLLDLRDKTLLSTKPIDGKTISAAKLVHVTIYLILLTASIAALPLIISVFRHGFLFFVLFLVLLIFMDLFVVMVTALMYFFILKFFDGEKLKDIINYIQILLSLGMLIGYQLLVRSFEFIDIEIVFHTKWWQIFIPPMWFGAPFELLLNRNPDVFIVIFSLFALIIPILSIYTYIKMMPSFERNLQKLSSHSVGKQKKHWPISEKLLNLMCATSEEKAFYRFAQTMYKNERKFKLKVYPSLGFSFVIPFIFIFNDLQYGSWSDLSSSKVYFAIYFSLLMIPTIVFMLKYSDKYKGAWIYKTTPINNKKIFIKAALKAFLVKLYLPIYILISVIFVLIFSVKIIPDLLIVFASALVYTIICVKGMGETALPFTESFEAAQQSDGIKAIGFFFFILFFVVFHFVSLLFPYGTFIYLFILIMLNLLIWRKAFS